MAHFPALGRIGQGKMFESLGAVEFEIIKFAEFKMHPARIGIGKFAGSQGLKAFNRRSCFAAPSHENSQANVSARMIGVILEGKANMMIRLFQLGSFLVQIAQVVVGHGKIRIDLHSLAIAGHGVFKLTLFLQGEANIVVGLHITRINVQGVTVTNQGFFKPA